MKLQITARNMDLTEAIRSYAEKRLGKLERFSQNIISSELILSEQRGQYNGELIVKVKGKTLKATSTEKDPLTVIDRLKDKMSDAIKAYEDRLKGQ